VRDLRAAGGEIHRDGGNLLIDGPPTAALFVAALRANATELAAHVVPRVTPEEAATVRMLLSDAGVGIAYITDPAAARLAVMTICADRPDVVGLDFETEALPAFRSAIPVAFTAQGIPAARQPRDGVAGAAIDPHRSKVRLVQACAGGEHCHIFDMRFVAWSDIAPLFNLPLAIFNATFEVKRLMHEAKIEPAGRIYDVMTAIWLTDGQRPSLGDAVAINYGLNIPKTLGASDWSDDALTPEQLEYAALDAVLCRQLWLTQQTELFDDIDKQCQELADAVTPAIARMELHGMPIDIGAHRKQVAQWEADLAVAQAALCRRLRGATSRCLQNFRRTFGTYWTMTSWRPGHAPMAASSRPVASSFSSAAICRASPSYCKFAPFAS
jgi:hypothetical protein